MKNRKCLCLVGRGAREAGAAFAFAERLTGALAAQGFELQVPILDSVEAVEAAAGEAARRGDTAIFLAGGDGTLRRMVRGLLAGRGAAGAAGGAAAAGAEAFPSIGLLPFGTVNCVARDIGMPRRAGPLLARILESLRLGRTRPYDLAFVAAGHAPEEPFLLSTGFGLEGAAILGTTPEAKRRFGAAAFIAAGFSLDLARLPRLRLEGDGIALEGTQVTIVNSATYGGSFRPFRGDSADGLLDLLVHTSRNLFDLGLLCATAGLGGLAGLRLASCAVRAIDSAPYHLDGDEAGILQAGEVARIRLAPRLLRFLA